MSSSTPSMLSRPRRNRKSAAIRGLVREQHSVLDAAHLVWPVFIKDAPAGTAERISALPGQHRYSIDACLDACAHAYSLGIRAVALFPAIEESLKNSTADEALNPDGLVPRCVRALKERLPELAVITDIALDPFNSDGHDGIVNAADGRIDNDRTLDVLAKMAVVHAQAGADIVAPSDMMDGRVEVIRRALDAAGFAQTVLVLSYCTKFCSALYGPFREALNSAPRHGDKKTYQMDFANRRDCLREIHLDEAEGADILMVKPATLYLDIIRLCREESSLPVAAYHVSGEYSMLHAAAEKGWLNYKRAMVETLMSIRRAGADLIFCYGACEVAQWIQNKEIEL